MAPLRYHRLGEFLAEIRPIYRIFSGSCSITSVIEQLYLMPPLPISPANSERLNCVGMEKKIYVIGHRNPDTESVVSVAALSNMKKCPVHRSLLIILTQQVTDSINPAHG
jgi:inorganic pyrophosphatase/exopolyphosphatase